MIYRHSYGHQTYEIEDMQAIAAIYLVRTMAKEVKGLPTLTNARNYVAAADYCKAVFKEKYPEVELGLE